MPTNIEKSYAGLGEELVAFLTERGLGAIPKRDLDALLLFLLEKHLGWSTRTNQELSILVRLPVPKIKALRYEGALRYIGDLDAEFRKRLRRLLRAGTFASENDTVQFIIEDYATRFVLEEYLKKYGRAATWSFNDESISAPVKTVAAIVVDQFDETGKIGALARLGIDDPEKLASVIEAAFLELFEEAKRLKITKLAKLGVRVTGLGKPARALAALLLEGDA